MGKVINLYDHVNPWREVMTLDAATSTLQVYVNEVTDDVELVQMNDDGEAIRTQLSAVDAALLCAAMTKKEKVAK